MLILIKLLCLSSVILGQVSALSCVPANFKQQCLDLSQQIGVKSTYYNGFCWVVNSTESTDWDSAFTKCQQGYENGRLAFVTSSQEREALKIVFDLAGLWSGLTRDTSKPDPEGWQFMNSDGALAYPKSDVVEWSLGSPFAGWGDAGVLTTNGYEQHDASMEHQFICQFPEPPSCPNKACFDSASTENKAATSMGDVIIDAITDVTIQRCSRLCAELATCQSFAYNKISKACELYWLPAEALTLEAVAGFEIFDRDSNEDNCETLIDCFNVCPPYSLTSDMSASYSDTLPDNTVMSGEAVTLSCTGLAHLYVNGVKHPTATHSVACTVFGWVTTDQIECAACDVLATTANGIFSYSTTSTDEKFPHETTAELQCNAGFYAVNAAGFTEFNPTVSCEFGKWPEEIANCAPVPTPFDMYEVYWSAQTDFVYMTKTQHDTKPAATKRGHKWSVIDKNDVACPEKVPLYRLKRLAPNNDHYYTADEAMKNSLDAGAAWVYEYAVAACVTKYGECGLTHELHQFYKSSITAHPYRRDVTTLTGYTHQKLVCYIF